MKTLALFCLALSLVLGCGCSTDDWGTDAGTDSGTCIEWTCDDGSAVCCPADTWACLDGTCAVAPDGMVVGPNHCVNDPITMEPTGTTWCSLTAPE